MSIFDSRRMPRAAAGALTFLLTAGLAVAVPTAASAVSETTGDLVISVDPAAPGANRDFYTQINNTAGFNWSNGKYTDAGDSATYANLTPGQYSILVNDDSNESPDWLEEFISPDGKNNYSRYAYDPSKVLNFTVTAGETTNVVFAPTLDIPENYFTYTVNTIGSQPDTSDGTPISAQFRSCEGSYVSTSGKASLSSSTYSIPTNSCVIPSVYAIGASVKNANGFVGGVGAAFKTTSGGTKSVSFERIANGMGGVDVPIYSVIPSLFLLSGQEPYLWKLNKQTGQYEEDTEDYEVSFDFGDALALRNLSPGTYKLCVEGIAGKSLIDLGSELATEIRCVGNEKFADETEAVQKSKTFTVTANKVTTLQALDYGNFGGPSKLLRTSGKTTVTGKSEVGSVLTGKAPEWETFGVKQTYQWLADNTPIAGATASTYRLTANEAGKSITLAVSAAKTGWIANTSVSAPTSRVARLNFAATKAPQISGSAKVANKLTLSAPTWNTSGVAVKYQWLANGKAIAGATATTYTVAAADAGKVITVQATASKAGYNTVTVLSAGTSKVAKSSATVSGKLKKASIKKSQSTSISVSVTTPGVSKPTGTVVVKVGKKTVKATLKASNAGKITVKLKGKALNVGKKQKVTVQFVPSGSTASAVTASKVVSAGKLTVTKK